ncbi:MAG: PIN domain-containing protein [Rhodocyclales bacterium]|jgi:predicted nucleic-acid-binding protein|nr:type II toxin-antitoxin system VapC family toxin [Rhodocyclaceae bacterium]PWB40172.1 MAG: PIN domain-containing protein [Rhodocyclales bacterium]GIK26614.1 MAG: PIN domain-containing protein [Betaproteobacteria bacterium]
MTGLDTNVLLRYIVRDDAVQAKAASRLIEERCSKERPGHVSHVVLAELAWVLGRGYGYAKEEVVKVLAAILTSAELRVQEAAIAWAALRAFQSGQADFADYLIGAVNAERGCETTFTFDKRAARSDWHTLL